MVTTGENFQEPKESWWRRWLVAPVVEQLTCGTSPDKIAWTIASGTVMGIFPVMGTTTLLCLLVGGILRLNQPVMHVFRAVVYPLHLALILPFIRLGERLYGVPLISFSIPELVGKFKDDPMMFARDFGMAAWHGVSAWLLLAPFLAIAVKFAAMPLLGRLARSLKKKKEARA